MSLLHVCLVYTLILHSIGKEIHNTYPSPKDMFWGLDAARREYTIPTLPFKFEELEPYLDADTLKIQYTSILKEYTSKMNTLLKNWRKSGLKTAKLADGSLISIWRKLTEFPEDFVLEFANWAGGYINHILFYSTMTPNSEGTERSPSKELNHLIENSLHNVTELKKDFSLLAEEMYDGGWVNLCRKKDKKGEEYLALLTTHKEMVPLDTQGEFPILSIDLWEHAYFKRYGANRKEYVANWWKTVDWIKVERLLNWWRAMEKRHNL